MKAPAKVDKVASIDADKTRQAVPPEATEKTVGDSDASAEPAPVDAPVVAEGAPIVAPRPAKPTPPPTAAAVMIQYQRIGREIHKLQELRGTSCTLELWALFRAIKLDASLATAQSRALLANALTEMQQRIERMRGITIHKSCLDNPLAPECQ